VYAAFLAGKPPEIRSHMVYMYGSGRPDSGQPCTCHMANPFLVVANLILVVANPVLANPARITWPTHFWPWPTRFWPTLHVLHGQPINGRGQPGSGQSCTYYMANPFLVVANPVLANSARINGQPISGCGQPKSGRGQPGSGQPCT